MEVSCIYSPVGSLIVVQYNGVGEVPRVCRALSEYMTVHTSSIVSQPPLSPYHREHGNIIPLPFPMRFFLICGEKTGQSAADAVVHIQPLVEELADEVIEMNPDQLEKYIKVGGHVRIIDGRYRQLYRQRWPAKV